MVSADRIQNAPTMPQANEPYAEKATCFPVFYFGEVTRSKGTRVRLEPWATWAITQPPDMRWALHQLNYWDTLKSYVIPKKVSVNTDCSVFFVIFLV